MVVAVDERFSVGLENSGDGDGLEATFGTLVARFIPGLSLLGTAEGAELCDDGVDTSLLRSGVVSLAVLGVVVGLC